jgi:hypothetical protein
MLSPDRQTDEPAGAFLTLILPDEGPYAAFIVETESKRKYVVFASTIPELLELIKDADAVGHTAYHACAGYIEARRNPRETPHGQRRYGRTKRNARCAKAFWCELDAGPGKPYPDWKAAACAVAEFCRATGMPRPLIVLSGFGIHVYWPLLEALDPETWERYARGLKALCVKHGLHADPARTADITSVLRTPGTHHRKSGERLVQCGKFFGPYALEQFAIFLSVVSEAAPKGANIEEELGPRPPHLAHRPFEGVTEKLLRSLSTTYEPSFAGLIAEHCEQVRVLRDSRGNLREPDWFACLGVLAFCEDGDRFAHEWSSGDKDRYTEGETQEYLDRYRQFGPTTCAKFHQLNSAVCEKCQFWREIRSPIVLGREQRHAHQDEKHEPGQKTRKEQRHQDHTSGQEEHDQAGQQGEQEQATQNDRAGQSRQEDENNAQSRKVSATPFKAFDFAQIPKRQWLYGRHYVRKHVTATVAPGGGAKTASKLVEAVSIAIGRDLLDGSKPIDRLRVWYWNGEDPLEEIERRIAAICVYYKIDPQELKGWLFIDSGRDTPICLATENRAGVNFNGEVINAINETLERNKLDVMILDPFISVHRVSENNNPLIDRVVKLLGEIANEKNCSIEIAHHVRKPSMGQHELTADDARGGGAIVNAVRSCQVLNRMSVKEAEQARIEQDQRFRYFRVDSGKQNLAPPEKAKWRYLESIDLPNCDNVQVVESWQYPSLFR